MSRTASRQRPRISSGSGPVGWRNLTLGRPATVQHRIGSRGIGSVTDNPTLICRNHQSPQPEWHPGRLRDSMPRC